MHIVASQCLYRGWGAQLRGQFSEYFSDSIALIAAIEGPLNQMLSPPFPPWSFMWREDSPAVSFAFIHFQKIGQVDLSLDIEIRSLRKLYQLSKGLFVVEDTILRAMLSWVSARFFISLISVNERVMDLMVAMVTEGECLTAYHWLPPGVVSLKHPEGPCVNGSCPHCINVTWIFWHPTSTSS